jgi:hypothetical protein
MFYEGDKVVYSGLVGDADDPWIQRGIILDVVKHTKNRDLVTVRGRNGDRNKQAVIPADKLTLLGRYNGEPFWMVVSDNSAGSGTKVKHHSKEKAIAELNRLVEVERFHTFFLLECVGIGMVTITHEFKEL